MTGYSVTWTSHTGISVDLAMGIKSDSGIWISAIDGFTSSPDVSTVRRSTGRGDIPTALDIPKMTGQMTLHMDPYLAEIPDMDVSNMWSYVESLFSVVSPGIMTIRDAAGHALTASFYLSSPIAFPGGRSPHTPGIREIEMGISLWSPDGGWQGEPAHPSPTSSTAGVLYNPGHLEEYVTLKLSPGGTAAQRKYTFTDVSGVARTVTLPSVTGVRYLSTNPGSGFAIESATGVRDRAAQVALRGQYIPGRIAPGEQATVSVGANVKATFTPYYLSPWR